MNDSPDSTGVSAFQDKLKALKQEECIERLAKEQERYATLVAIFKQFHKRFEQGDSEDPVFCPSVGSRIYLSEQVLRFAVRCYFDSVFRYKMFSGTDHADRHKQAGYLYKWIAKTKPIQILPVQGSYVEWLNWVNAYFATHVALAVLFNEREHKDDRPVYDASQLIIQLDKKVYRGLVYQAQYRNISGRAAAIQLCSIENECIAKFELSQIAGRQAPE